LIDKFCDKDLCPVYQRSFIYGTFSQKENQNLKYELNDINNRINSISLLLNRLLIESNISIKNNLGYIPTSESSNLIERDYNGKVYSHIFIDCIQEYIPIECSFCSNFKKIDIESTFLTKDSIEVLSK